MLVEQKKDYETIKEVNYYEYYSVNQNDSLLSIAKEKNVNPNLLAVLNGLEATDYLFKGQIIMIPKNNYSYYITKDGDTINTVSETFNTKSNYLLKDNPTVYLKEGQLIVHRIK